MAIACLVGLFASAYLLYTYVSGAPIVCGLVSGCEVVRASQWAWTYGIPRPLLGVIFYTGMFALLVIRASTDWRAIWLYRLTVLSAAVGFVESAWLVYVQKFILQAWCAWCLVSALSATAIAVAALFDRQEQPRAITAERELKTYFVLLLIFVPVAVSGFWYLI